MALLTSPTPLSMPMTPNQVDGIFSSIENSIFGPNYNPIEGMWRDLPGTSTDPQIIDAIQSCKLMLGAVESRIESKLRKSYAQFVHAINNVCALSQVIITSRTICHEAKCDLLSSRENLVKNGLKIVKLFKTKQEQLERLKVVRIVKRWLKDREAIQDNIKSGQFQNAFRLARHAKTIYIKIRFIKVIQLQYDRFQQELKNLKNSWEYALNHLGETFLNNPDTYESILKALLFNLDYDLSALVRIHIKALKSEMELSASRSIAHSMDSTAFQVEELERMSNYNLFRHLKMENMSICFRRVCESYYCYLFIYYNIIDWIKCRIKSKDFEAVEMDRNRIAFIHLQQNMLKHKAKFGNEYPILYIFPCLYFLSLQVNSFKNLLEILYILNKVGNIIEEFGAQGSSHLLQQCHDFSFFFVADFYRQQVENQHQQVRTEEWSPHILTIGDINRDDIHLCQSHLKLFQVHDMSALRMQFLQTLERHWKNPHFFLQKPVHYFEQYLPDLFVTSSFSNTCNDNVKYENEEDDAQVFKDQCQSSTHSNLQRKIGPYSNPLDRLEKGRSSFKVDLDRAWHIVIDFEKEESPTWLSCLSTFQLISEIVSYLQLLNCTSPTLNFESLKFVKYLIQSYLVDVVSQFNLNSTTNLIAKHDLDLMKKFEIFSNELKKMEKELDAKMKATVSKWQLQFSSFHSNYIVLDESNASESSTISSIMPLDKKRKVAKSFLSGLKLPGLNFSPFKETLVDSNSILESQKSETPSSNGNLKLMKSIQQHVSEPILTQFGQSQSTPVPSDYPVIFSNVSPLEFEPYFSKLLVLSNSLNCLRQVISELKIHLSYPLSANSQSIENLIRSMTSELSGLIDSLIHLSWKSLIQHSIPPSSCFQLIITTDWTKQESVHTSYTSWIVENIKRHFAILSQYQQHFRVSRTLLTKLFTLTFDHISEICTEGYSRIIHVSQHVYRKFLQDLQQIQYQLDRQVGLILEKLPDHVPPFSYNWSYLTDYIQAYNLKEDDLMNFIQHNSRYTKSQLKSLIESRSWAPQSKAKLLTGFVIYNSLSHP